jgi:hypothetical protein
MGFIRAAGF